MNSSVVRPHVLLLPGNMCDARLWSGNDNAILRTITAFDYEFTCVDFKTDASIEAMAMRTLDITDSPLIVIGFSMGGIVALQMAQMAPQRLIGLCLIDTTANLDKNNHERLRQQSDVRAGFLERVIVDELKPRYLAKVHERIEPLLSLIRDMAVRLGPEVFVAQSEALRTRKDLTPVLTQLLMPVFLACGNEDRLCPPSLHQSMARKIKHASFHNIAYAGHLLPLEQPTLMSDVLVDFFLTLLE
jgi:pimeloyl-ACP methyl ester carboxylesterase